MNTRTRDADFSAARKTFLSRLILVLTLVALGIVTTLWLGMLIWAAGWALAATFG